MKYEADYLFDTVIIEVYKELYNYITDDTAYTL